MKPIVLALTLCLMLLPNHRNANRRDSSGVPQDTQAKNELSKLEARLKQIEEESGPITVKVTGDNESSGNVTISVEREASVTTSATDLGGEKKAGTKGTLPKKTAPPTETLLNIDLNKIKVPDEYINEKVAALFSGQTMCGTIPGVKLSQVGVSVDYQVVEDYSYDSGTYKITVFKGFIYDRASIPRICWVFIDKDSVGNVAPLFHDLLYRHGGVLPQNQLSPYKKFSRKETDDLFLELATKCGVSELRRELVYEAVRKIGWLYWKGD